MTGNEQSQATQLALMRQQIERMEVHLESNDGKIDALEAERDKALRWGIGLLGAAVLGLAGIIARFVGDHLK